MTVVGGEGRREPPQTADEPPIFRGFCFSVEKSATFLGSSQKGLNSETFAELAGEPVGPLN